MKKELPMTTPAIRCYANYAHVFSILGAQSDEFYQWMLNYYVQLYVMPKEKYFNADFMITRIYTDTPNLFTSKIERSIALNTNGGIINFIKNCIDNGYYIYALLEVEHIVDYKREAIKMHDPLVYGYDDEKEEVYFADTYKGGRYAFGKANYSEIKRAFDNTIWRKKSISEMDLDILCMKYRNEGNENAFDKDMYIKLLDDYVNKRNSYELYWKIPGEFVRNKTPRVCGIDIYSILHKHIQYVENNGEKIDIRGFYVIVEHKQLLERALSFILGCEWEERYPLEGKTLQTIINCAKVMLNLGVKYNITKDITILNKLRRHATEIETNEIAFYPSIIKIIKEL